MRWTKVVPQKSKQRVPHIQQEGINGTIKTAIIKLMIVAKKNFKFISEMSQITLKCVFTSQQIHNYILLEIQGV
jgi:hypothetical protein